jgi:SAM-dependent methyltransferase
MPRNNTCRWSMLWLTILCAGALMDGRVNAQDPLFSEADAYEQFMGRWSRSLAPLLVRFADVRDSDAILDVGSGTGALAAAVAASAPSATVVGIDPAAAYVASAQSKRPSDKLTFEVGDARKMRFEDAAFNRTLSLLVINFIPDPQKALLEMKRVTRPGGIVAAAVWDYGDGMEMLRTFWDAAIALRPDDGLKDERHMPLCGRGELAALWRREGLASVVEEGLTIETRFSSFDDYWIPFTLKQGPAGAYVAGLAPAEREALRLRLRQRLVGDGPDHPLVLNARAWAVRGIVR